MRAIVEKQEPITNLSRTAIRKMKVNELKKELDLRGLDTTGLRSVLVDRLLEGALSRKALSTDDAVRFDTERLYVLRFRGHTNFTYGEAGVGFVLYDTESSKEAWSARLFFGREQSRFEAEYRGLVDGLQFLYDRGVRRLVLQSDNEVLLKQLNGNFKVRKENLERLYWAAINLKESFTLFELNSINSTENSRAVNLARTAVATKLSRGLEKGTHKKAGVEGPSLGVSARDGSGAYQFKPDKEYLLRFDGGARGNPGIAGVGMVIYDASDNSELWCGWKFIKGTATNNEAEYIGLMVGLKCAKSLGVKRLHVEGDSDLVVKQINGRYKIGAGRLKPLHKACKSLMSEFQSCSIQHIPRANNKRADELANQAMDSQESWGFEEDEPPAKPTETSSGGTLQPDKEYLLRFDGGSRGNPGLAGAGMVLLDPLEDLEVWSGWKFMDREATNNEAEYTGLLCGLKCARSLGVTRLQVEGDSELVVKQMLGEYAVKASRLKPLHQACKSMVSEFDTFRIRHIRREQNKRADKLANEAMESEESFGLVVEI